MVDLMLHEEQQGALRALMAAEPTRDCVVPGERLLAHLAVLLSCDLIVLAHLDDHGRTLAEVCHPSTAHATAWTRCAPRIGLVVRNGRDHVVQLWLIRRSPPFSDGERAVLALATPAMEKVLREPPHTGSHYGLTAQEERVLHHVAAGMSNAEVAHLLYLSTGTVRKHLEHAYRKLGVTNRFAAVQAYGGPPGLLASPVRPLAVVP